MKTYILSYNFNGVNHMAEIENISSCLRSLYLAGMAGKLENVTFYAK